MTAEQKYQREYAKKHRKRLLAYYRRYNNTEERRTRTRAWCRANYARVLFNAARARAKRRNVVFGISLQHVVIPKRCPILGIPLRRAAGTRNENSATVDRINPRKGYIPGNIAVISYRANRIKNDGTSRELRLIANFVAQASTK